MRALSVTYPSAVILNTREYVACNLAARQRWLRRLAPSPSGNSQPKDKDYVHVKLRDMPSNA